MNTIHEFLKLQNGSDIRGIALEGVEGEAVNLTSDVVQRISAAFAEWIGMRLHKAVTDIHLAIGHDSRLSAQDLMQAAVVGLQKQGVSVFTCGMASTPAMFMSTVFPDIAMDGAIMITASHLPYNRNGLKFFTGEGGLEKEDIKNILRRAASLSFASARSDKVQSLPLMERYAQFLRDNITSALGGKRQPLQGMHMVVDAGNGAGGFFATAVLAPLGANIEGSQYLEPDGYFPHHVPNPEDETAMQAIQQAVIRSGCDIGFIFDTDVDRMSAVLADGKLINRNGLIAMMAAILSAEYPGSTIVTDSVTSDELTVFLEKELGLVHHRYMRGYKNVINECKRLNKEGIISPLAIETSGHGALKENYYLDDGAYLAVKLVIAAAWAKQEGRPLYHYISRLQQPVESREYRLPITETDDPVGYGNLVLAVLAQRAREQHISIATPSYEGVRLIFPEGWALLRMSLHDAEMPLNLESKKVGGCQAMAQQIYSLLYGFAYLKRQILCHS